MASSNDSYCSEVREDGGEERHTHQSRTGRQNRTVHLLKKGGTAQKHDNGGNDQKDKVVPDILANSGAQVGLTPPWALPPSPRRSGTTRSHGGVPSIIGRSNVYVHSLGTTNMERRQSACSRGAFWQETAPKPCHDLLYISGAFRRLYPVGTNAKSMSCWTENARRAERLSAWGR